MKSAFGMCFNWKVLAGLAAVAVALLVFAPGYAFAALPLLLLLACPLSMGFMMFAMRGGHGQSSAAHCAPRESSTALQQRLDALHEEERRLESQLRANEADASQSPETALRRSKA